MPEILHNERISKDFYLMKVKAENTAAMGQFYMLRAWGDYPLLSRPISVFDADGQTVSFLYKVVGKGTEIFATLKPGDEITLDGPHGNGFPEAKGTVALVGGGVVSVPGAFSPSEIRQSFLDGADIVKIFPAGRLGSRYVSDIQAPLGKMPLMVVGGIGTSNVQEYFAAGASFAGIGSGIFLKEDILNENEEGIRGSIAAMEEKMKSMEEKES